MLTKSELKFAILSKSWPKLHFTRKASKKSFLKFTQLRTKSDQFSNQSFELLNRNLPIKISVRRSNHKNFSFTLLTFLNHFLASSTWRQSSIVRDSKLFGSLLMGVNGLELRQASTWESSVQSSFIVNWSSLIILIR